METVRKSIDTVKAHPFISVCVIIGTLWGAVVGIRGLFGLDPIFWANATDLRKHIGESVLIHVDFKEQLELAAEDRRGIRYEQYNSAVKDIQRQLYDNAREQRVYQRQREAVPEPVLREQDRLKSDLEDKLKQRDRYAPK